MSREEVEEHVKENCLVLLDKGAKGFTSYKAFEYNGDTALFINGTVVREQGKGGFGAMARAAIHCERPDFLILRTQNPCMYAGAAKLTDRLFPSEAKPPTEVRDLGIFVAGMLGMENYDASNHLGKDTYGRCLYETIPEHPKYSELFSRVGVDIEAGDSIIVIGEISDKLRYRRKLNEKVEDGDFLLGKYIW